MPGEGFQYNDAPAGGFSGPGNSIRKKRTVFQHIDVLFAISVPARSPANQAGGTTENRPATRLVPCITPFPDLPPGEGRTLPDVRPRTDRDIGIGNAQSHLAASGICREGRSAPNSSHGMAPLRDGTKADLRTGTDPATGYLSGGLPLAWSPATDFSVPPANRHRRLRPRPAEKFAAAARGLRSIAYLCYALNQEEQKWQTII